ncbi:MAG: aminotransferase class V-fold PLP-dependent enzyme [Thermoanaerobaculia bacterium]
MMKKVPDTIDQTVSPDAELLAADRDAVSLRDSEFSRLVRSGETYVDYTGAALYPESLVRDHHALLLEEVSGNPHSTSPAAARSTQRLTGTRDRILAFFNAPTDEYEVIFTPNASGALRIVGEAYPFGCNGRYLLTSDNHNSVNGIREYARARGSDVRYIPITLSDLRLDAAVLAAELEGGCRVSPRLFAYPAQSNFSGVQHSLQWIEKAHQCGWDVLLDAAAFVPTNRLDLSLHKPEFAVVSFYKMFGYPTGIGALIAKRSALARLHRPWFAGGTITVASVKAERYAPARDEAAFEDGTQDFLSIPAIALGLDYLERLGIDRIHRRVELLTGWTLRELESLHHANGSPLVHIYGPLGSEERGGTIALNVFDASGEMVDHRVVEALASRAGISLRTGCFCNPGAGETALEIPKQRIVTCFEESDGRLTLDDFKVCLHGGSGAVRISFGYASVLEDARRVVEFVSRFLD